MTELAIAVCSLMRAFLQYCFLAGEYSIERVVADIMLFKAQLTSAFASQTDIECLLSNKAIGTASMREAGCSELENDR
jgi:hypothetical protein